MNDFIVFLVRSRAFILFVLMEALALYSVYRFNNHGSAILFNNTNSVVASMVSTQNSVLQYSRLGTVNTNLSNENILLHKQIAELEAKLKGYDGASIAIDSSLKSNYSFLSARAINYTVNLRNNYITIDKGTAQGLQPGMGVISASGVVGKIKYCSENLSLVTSILHSENLISSKLKKSGKLGTLKWDGLNPKIAELQYIDMYEKIAKGDTVLTSDLNSVFPGNIMLGTVIEKELKKGEQSFHIKVKLSTDFRNLAHVYVVKNSLTKEQETLEATVITDKK
jgi:rod shape-determining protein MreC